MTSIAAPTVTYDVELMAADMAAKGYIQKDLADRACVSPMAVSRFLRRERQSAPTAKKLAKALGHSVRRYMVLPTADRRTEASPL